MTLRKNTPVAMEELAADRQRLQRLVEEQSKDLLDAQRQLMQSEKLASVGQLAAGIAHEINTPIQYVGDNLRALADCYSDLAGLIARYRELVELVKTGEATPQVAEGIVAAERNHDLEYLLDDGPKAIKQGLEGVDRVANIVRAMKDFSHIDRGEISVVDVNRALEATLTVARNEYKYVADLETGFGELPHVECYASELNQVFLNLVVNAAHAIADTKVRGKITVRTRPNGDQVEVSISDTGTGIPEGIRERIFDPFFTTKGVGKGTGQGLTIAHQIVVGRHGGSITFDTEIGKGTTFTLHIPVVMENQGQAAADGECDAEEANSVC